MVDDARELRQPLTELEQLAWHRAALRGDKPATHLDEPHAGWFKTRLVRGGPFVAARIWWEQEVDEAGELISEPRLRCVVDGKECDAHDRWSWLAGRPITRDDYISLLGSRFTVPEEKATPPATEKVDWSKMKVPF